MKKQLSFILLNFLLITTFETFTKKIQHKNIQYQAQCGHSCYKKKAQFDKFNRDDILLPGTMELPGAAQRFKNQNYLKPYEIQYLNLVHWLHHLLQEEQTYQYLKNTDITIYYKGNPITITNWRLDHVFVGDLFPNSQFITGMHYDHDGLKNFYHYKNIHAKGYISHPAYPENTKITRLFPKKWSTLTTIKKVVKALHKKHLHISEMNGKLRIKAMIDNIPFMIVIKPHGDLNTATTGTVITFYPRYA